MRLEILFVLVCISKTLAQCPDLKVLGVCSCNNSVIACSPPEKHDGYYELPNDLFKNMSDNLRAKSLLASFSKLILNKIKITDSIPILWDITFEYIVFNECDIRNAINVFADNYHVTTSIQVLSSAVSAEFLQELGKFKKLAQVKMDGHNKNVTSSQFEMRDNALYPFNGFQDNFKIIYIKNYEISMDVLKHATLPFAYLRNLQIITFDHVTFDGNGPVDYNFFQFAKGSETIEINFKDCHGVVDKKFFHDNAFNNTQRKLEITFELTESSNDLAISLLPESNFKFLEHYNKNVSVTFKGVEIDCFNCSNEWVLRPRNLTIECDDGRDLLDDRHFRAC